MFRIYETGRTMPSSTDLKASDFARIAQPSSSLASVVRCAPSLGSGARLEFARHVSVLLALVCGAVVPLSSASCRVFEPSNKPIDACRRSCEQKAKRQCTPDLCERGCEMIVDRLVEREGDKVIACVASSPRRCTDVVWADCAARVGVHADGGPPGPPPPPEEE